MNTQCETRILIKLLLSMTYIFIVFPMWFTPLVHDAIHFSPWSLNLLIRVPFQLHGENTVLQPFRHIKLIVHIAISVLSGTKFHLSQVKHLRVKCLAQGHTIETMPKIGMREI